MKKAELITDINQTINWLIKVINPDSYNDAPYEGCWTTGQVVEHICMVGDGFHYLLNGETEITNRPVDKHLVRIKTMFLFFEQKSMAAPNVTPTLNKYNLNDHLVKLETIKLAIINDVEILDMTKTCCNFEIPTFGYFTRLEAVYFFLFHTKRHIHQIQNIVNQLSKSLIQKTHDGTN